MNARHQTQQTGFDFGSNQAPALAEDPPGTWLEPSWPSEEYRLYLVAAEQALPATHALLQPLFRTAIDQARSHLCDLDETCEDDGGGFSLPRVALDIDTDMWCRFVQGCTYTELAGAETVARHGEICDIFAAHVAGVGTLVARRWTRDSYALDYEVGRGIELRTSFSDGAPQYVLPATLWWPCYSAQRLAEAGEQPAHVHTVMRQGRRYVIDGTHSHRGRSEGHAWAIATADEWRGPTYSYRTQCKSWDEGRAERGDRRGLRVMVDKQLCVLSSYALFVDPNDTHVTVDATGLQTAEDSTGAEDERESEDDADA